MRMSHIFPIVKSSTIKRVSEGLMAIAAIAMSLPIATSQAETESPAICSAAPTVTVSTTGDISSQITSLFPSSTTQRIVKFPAGNYTISGSYSMWVQSNTVIQAEGATITMNTANRNLIVAQGDGITICGGTWVGNNQAVLRAAGVSNIVVDNATFKGGTHGAVFESGSLGNTITNSALSGNSANGVLVQGGSALTVASSNLTNNGTNGASVNDANTQLTITDSNLTNNKKNGLALNGGTAIVSGVTTITGNTEYGVVAESATVNMTDVIVTSNGLGTSPKSGIVVNTSSTVKLTRVTVNDNGYVGLSVLGNSAVTVIDSQIASNKGGGVWAQDPGTKVTLSGTSVSNNTNVGIQGAHSATMTFQASNTVNNNSDTGLFVGKSSGIAVGNATVSITGEGNTFNSNGSSGIIVTDDSTLTATSGITANSNGNNGVFVESGSTMSFTDLTASNNSNFGLYFDGGTITGSGTAVLNSNAHHGLSGQNGTATFDRVTANNNQQWGVLANTASTVTVLSCLIATGNTQGAYREVNGGVVNSSPTCSALSSAKDITSLTIGSVSGTINGTQISIVLPVGTDVTTLTPDIIHTGVSISPAGQQDFSTPVTYTVTAEDRSTKTYTVIATVSAPVTIYTVTFVDGLGTTLKIQRVESGQPATAPANPTRDGYTFTGWDTAFNQVTSNLTVTAKWSETPKPATYTVTFVDGQGTTLKTEQVVANLSATAPANPTRQGFTFTGWDTAFTRVTSDITVTALWEAVQAPAQDNQSQNNTSPNVDTGGTASSSGNDYSSLAVMMMFLLAGTVLLRRHIAK